MNTNNVTQRTMGTSNIGQEAMSAEDKKKYDEAMEEIQAILGKATFSAEDVQRLKKAMKTLEELNKQGKLEYTVKKDTDFILKFLNEAGITSEETDFIDPQLLETLKTISLEHEGTTLTIEEALSTLALNATRHKHATHTLQTMIYLNFLEYSTEVYEKKLLGLEESLALLDELLRLGTAFQEILNQVDVELPVDFKIPPSQLSHIPEELQKKWALKYGGGAKVPLTTEKLVEMINWIKKDENVQEYTGWAKDYFRGQLGVTPIANKETLERLLNNRENIRNIFDKIVENGGDVKEEGSLANSLDKLLKNLDKAFNPEIFPTDVEDYGKWLEEHPIEAERGLLYLKGWIWDGRYTEENVKLPGFDTTGERGATQNILNKVLIAGNNVSETEKQDLNKLQHVFDNNLKMATSIVDTVDKMIKRAGQKISG